MLLIMLLLLLLLRVGLVQPHVPKSSRAERAYLSRRESRNNYRPGLPFLRMLESCCLTKEGDGRRHLPAVIFQDVFREREGKL